jgi:hypothetical protein
MAAVFRGAIPGQGAAAGNEMAALESWYLGPATQQTGGPYANEVCGILARQSNGAPLPALANVQGQAPYLIPISPTQWMTGAASPQQAYIDPCQTNPNNSLTLPGAAGAGWPVSDAITEANTGAAVEALNAIQQNTDVVAQLQYQLCEAQEQAWRTNVQTDTQPSQWDASSDTAPDTQIPEVTQ